MHADEIVLGTIYQDRISDMRGVATSLLHNLEEETQVLLENKKTHRWFAVSRLVEVAV